MPRPHPERRQLSTAVLIRATILAAVAGLLLMPTPASAQADPAADNGILDGPDEIHTGECSPESVGVEELVTCRFALAHPGDVIPEWGVRAILSAQEFPDWNDDYRRTVCHIARDWLVCPDLAPDWDEGTQRVFVDLDFDVPHGEVVMNQSHDGVLGLIGVAGRLPVAFAGHPRTFNVYRSYQLASDEEASLLVRRAGSDDVHTEVPALAGGEEEAFVEVTFPSAGRWTITACNIAAESGCVREGFRREVQVIEPRPVELVPGHNLPGADRINLLFVGAGWRGELQALTDAAALILSLDGEPIRQGASGNVAAPDEEAIYLEWGPFSIDPLRGNAHKFNFWYLGTDVPSQAFQRSPTTVGIEGIDLAPLGLGPNVAVVIMSRADAASGTTASAELPSFQDDPAVGATPEVVFGSTILPFTFAAGNGATTFSHEIGHLLFALADEYSVYEADNPRFGYPNCPRNVAEAEAWWGDLIGELDPMFQRWVATESKEGTWWNEDDLTADFTVGFVAGGCYSDATEAVRPTSESLMNMESPVFGAVNRRRAEEVLALWSGRAAFDATVHADHIVASCRVDGELPNTRAVCRADVDPYLDAPGPVTLSLGGPGDSSVECSWTVMSAGAVILCPPVPISAGPTRTPVLRLGGQAMNLDPIVAPAPTTATATTTTPSAQSTAPPAEAPGFPWPTALLAGGMLAFGAGAGVLLIRRRNRHAAAPGQTD